MEVAVIVTRLDGEIIYWNRFAEELYGWPEEVIGRNIVVTGGKSWTGEFKVKRKDGAIFTVLVTDSTIFEETGAPIGIVGVSHNLTAHQQTPLSPRLSLQVHKVRACEKTTRA